MPFLDLAGDPLWVTDWSEAPRPGGVTFLLLHGAGMDHTVWALVGRRLAAAGHGVLAPDLPGHGRSGGAPRGRIEAIAEAVVAMLDRLRPPRPIPVGHSMGALVALETAARWPVAALAPVAAAPRMAVHPDLLALAARDAVRAAELMVTWSFPRSVRFGAQPVPGAWLPAAARRLLAARGPSVLGADLGACDAYRRAAEVASRVRVPALVVAGARDRMTRPVAGRALVGVLTWGRFLCLEECCHMIPLERPRALAEALLALAAEASATASSAGR